MPVCSGVDGAMATNDWQGEAGFSDVWPRGSQCLSSHSHVGAHTIQRAVFIQQLPERGGDEGGIPSDAVVEGEARSGWVGEHFTPPPLLAVLRLVLVRVHGRDARARV